LKTIISVILIDGRKIELPLNSIIEGSNFSGDGWKLFPGPRGEDYHAPREKTNKLEN